jgi:hypothetical protein
MERQITDLTVTELKAVAYDQMAQIELAQNNLRAINEELRKRLQPQQQGQPVIEPLPAGSIQSV